MYISMIYNTQFYLFKNLDMYTNNVYKPNIHNVFAMSQLMYTMNFGRNLKN